MLVVVVLLEERQVEEFVRVMRRLHGGYGPQQEVVASRLGQLRGVSGEQRGRALHRALVHHQVRALIRYYRASYEGSGPYPGWKHFHI